MSDTGKRARNFSPFEKNLLIDLVLQRKDVIENKRTDGATLAEKKRCWEDLCNVFNASSQTGDRTAKQLKELYFVMKRNARKHNNENWIGYLQTGGGTHNTKSDETDLKIVGVFNKQFEPDDNSFDSSAVMFENAGPLSDDVNSSTAEASCIIHTATDDSSNVKLEIEWSDNDELITRNDHLSTPSHREAAPKRQSNYLQSVSESIVNRKKAKTDIDVELAAIKTKELEMKEIQHNKKCEILDIEKKIALKELEKQEYELKIKELEYKIKLKQFEMM